MISTFRSARHDPALVVLEGLHAVKHARRFGAELLEVVVAGARETELCRQLAPDLLPVLRQATRADAATFGQLAPHAPVTGVLAIARRPRVSVHQVLAVAAPVVYLESPAHLGNLGACVRVAAAAGAGGVLCCGPHDPWSPEAVRGAAGLQFALPVARCDELPPTARPLLALHPQGEPLAGTSISSDAVVAFGSERSGLSPALLQRADSTLAIPMREGVSSLNLATAVAVVLYAWRLSG